MRYNLRKALSFQRLKGPDININGLLLVIRGAPMPSKTIKSGSLTNGNIAATFKSTEISGLF
jgi:hypothetical protein